MAAAAPWHLAGEAPSLSRLLPARPQRPSPGQGAPRHPHRRLGRQDRCSPPRNPIRATNDWDTSSAEACVTAQDHWTMIENTGGGWQAVIAENAQLPDPEWPPHTTSQILRVAFKG